MRLPLAHRNQCIANDRRPVQLTTYLMVYVSFKAEDLLSLFPGHILTTNSYFLLKKTTWRNLNTGKLLKLYEIFREF